MSASRTQQFNRAYVDKLKSKGKVWLENDIEEKEKAIKASAEEDLASLELHLTIIKKALKELDLSSDTL